MTMTQTEIENLIPAIGDTIRISANRGALLHTGIVHSVHPSHIAFGNQKVRWQDIEQIELLNKRCFRCSHDHTEQCVELISQYSSWEVFEDPVTCGCDDPERYAPLVDTYGTDPWMDLVSR